VKAVLYRHTGLAGSKEYDKIVLADDALALHVNGDYVTIQRPGAAYMVAAVKLADDDHIKFED
jgi:hypothetical protein